MGYYFAPQLEEQFSKKYKREINGSRRMDETYLKIKGEDVYLYRAVDKLSNTIDFMLSKKHDKKAVFSFFCKAINQHGLPEKVTMDKSGANKAGIELHRMLKKDQHKGAANLPVYKQFYALAA